MLVMRLKLLAVPALIAMAAQWGAAEQLLPALRRWSLWSRISTSAVPVLLALAAVQGVANIRLHVSRVGEFNNPILLQTADFVDNKLSPQSILAGMI